jgi:hypothetical protein
MTRPLACTCRVAVVAAVLFAVGGPRPLEAASPPSACARYAAPRPVGTVPRPLAELSGIAASRRHAGVWWGHNDSGNDLELFALRTDGRLVARFAVRGVDAADAEDAAVGPCAGDRRASCIWVGDVGDNLHRRPFVQVIEVPEPARLDGRPLTGRAVSFVYPRGARNAEAILVDPESAAVYVVTKPLLSTPEVFRVDTARARGPVEAVRVARLDLPLGFEGLLTAADLHPLRTRLLLRTYGRAWELRSDRPASIETLLGARPVAVPTAEQPQGEAAAYTHDGRGYLLGSEGAGSALHLVECDDAP